MMVSTAGFRDKNEGNFQLGKYLNLTINLAVLSEFALYTTPLFSLE